MLSNLIIALALSPAFAQDDVHAPEPATLDADSTENEPAEDAPAKDAPTEDEPAEDEPAEDAPAEDAPAEDPPAVAKPAVPTPAVATPAVPTPAVATPTVPARHPAGWTEVHAPVTRSDYRYIVNDGSNSDTGVIIYGGLYGAYMAGMSTWLVGEALESSEEAYNGKGVPYGVLIGAATGAATAHFVNIAAPGTPSSTAHLFTDTLVGGYYGQQAGRMLIPLAAPGAHERILASGMAGTMAGIGVSVARPGKAHAIGNQVHFMGATGIGWVTGRGIGDMIGWERVEQRRERATVETSASLAMGGAAMLANRLGVEAPKAQTVAMGLVDGAWFGTWTPYLVVDDPSDKHLAGGAQAGLGLGYLATLTMSVAGQPSPKSVGLQGIGLAAGSALGAGIPLALGDEGPTRLVVGPMLAAGAAGQVLGAVTAPHYEIEDNDKVLLGSLQAWTAYQAAGWATFGRQAGAEDQQVLGYALTAGGAGTLMTMGLVPVLDVSPEGSVMLLSGGAWGTWFGAWGSQMAHADADQLWLASLAAGDGALLASAVGQAAGWKPTWRQAAGINGGGLAGAAAGGLVGAIALYDPDDWTPISTSIVAGSGVGLIAGGVLSATSGKRSVETASRHTLLPKVSARLPFRARSQVLPWVAEGSDDPGVWVQLDLTER